MSKSTNKVGSQILALMLNYAVGEREREREREREI